MSISSPKYTELCETLIKNLDLFLGKIDQNPDQTRIKEAHQKIVELKAAIDFEQFAGEAANVKDFSERSIRVIKDVYNDLIAEEINEEESDEEGVDTQEYEQALLTSRTIMEHTLKEFCEVVSHKEALETNGLEAFLGEEWAQSQFVFLLENQDPWALNKWSEFLENGEELGLKILELMDTSFYLYGPIFKPILDELILRADTSEALQITLQAYMVAHGSGSIFYYMFIEKIGAFKAEYGLPEDSWCSIQRACDLVEYYFTPFSEGMGVNLLAFDWDEFPLHFRVSFFRQYFIRERKLIGLYTGKLAGDQFIDPPLSKCFPKTERVLMSFRTDHSACLLFVAQALEAYKIPITLFSSESLLEDHPPFLEKRKEINVDSRGISPGIWVQDYCHIGEEEIRVPSILVKPDGLDYYITGARDDRMEERFSEYTELPFWPYGESLGGGNSFRLFSKLYQHDPSCQSFSFQFIALEGGNYSVVGDRVFVGKDSLASARLALEDELKELGIMKEGGKLSDEELRRIFAADMGVSSPEKVVFIEQPGKYHLDVASVIVKEGPGKPVVWVNDSVMAIEEWALYADKHEEKEEELINDEGVQSYDERLEKVREMAKYYKQYEDAAAEDYEAAGFSVVRIGGSMENLNRNFSNNYRTNFFNFSSMTTPSGEKVILALGSEPYFNQKFEALVKEHIGEDVKVRFCDKSVARDLLALNGGLNCCIKRLGGSLRLSPKMGEE